MLSSLKMRTKLIGGYLFVIVLSLIVSGVSIYSINEALKVNENLNEKVLYNVNRTLGLYASYSKVHSWLHQIQVSPSPELVEVGLVYVNQLEEHLKKVQAQPPTLYQDLVYQAREASTKMVDAMKGDFFINLQNGRYKQADAIFLDRVLPHSLAASKAFNDLVMSFNKDINEGIKALVLDDELHVVIIVTILGVIVALILGFAISNYIVNHTMKIKEICSEIQHGNFDLSIKNVPKDEIGDIYNSLQEIVTTLNKTIARVIAASNALKNYSHELNTASWSINDGAVKAESQSITVAAAADEMVSTTSDIAKNCHTAQETSSGTKNETNVGVEKVRTTVARIKEQSVQTREDAEKVLRLAEQSQKIGSIVGTIDEIAAQTNLLALNAAIEAARAGEAGRGFAVVADEVRALASRTSKSTQEITAMVKSVQEDSEAATNSMNASVEQMEEMASRASELEETLNHIMYSVNDVNTQIIQIATAAEEQTSATAEISSNMQAITEMAQQSIDVATNAANISDYAVHLIDRLMKDLDFFTLNESALDKKDLIIEGSKEGIVMEDTNKSTSPTEQGSSDEHVEPMPVK